MKSTRPKKSDVWKYYEIDSEDDSRALCNLCKPCKIISRGSKMKGPQSYGTSALWAHLKLSHKTEYSSLEKCPSYPRASRIAKVKRVLLNNDTQEFIHLDNSQNMPMEETLQEVSSEYEEQLNSIGQMIAIDNQPISIVEDEGFKKMLKAFLPSCNMINSFYLGNQVLPNIYYKTKSRIQELLQKISDLTVCIDIDQVALQTETLVTITATWLNEDCTRSNFVLSTSIFPTFPSHKIIDALFHDTLHEFNVDVTKVHLVLHPYAQKAVASTPAVQGVDNETYFQLLIQLLVEDALLSQPNVTRVLDLCRNLVCYSTETRETLDLLNFLHSVPFLRRPDSELVLDSNSNWQSTYKMLQNIKENMEEINNISNLNQALNITSEDWLVISHIIDILEPIHELANSITSSTNIISNVIPFMATIHRYFNTNPSTLDSEVIQNVKNVFYKKIYEHCKIEERKILVLATVLDPRYKLSFLSDQCKQNSRNWLLEHIQVNQPSNFIPHVVKTEPTEKKNIWNCYTEITAEKNESSTNENLLLSEINEYVTSRLLEREQNPFEWWKANKTFFPNLFRMAKQFLTPPMVTPFTSKKNDHLLMRLRRSCDEDEPTNAFLDINQRLFLHFNLSSAYQD